MLEAGNQGWGAQTTSRGCQPSSPCHPSLCDPGQSLSLCASLPWSVHGGIAVVPLVQLAQQDLAALRSGRGLVTCVTVQTPNLLPGWGARARGRRLCWVFGGSGSSLQQVGFSCCHLGADSPADSRKLRVCLWGVDSRTPSGGRLNFGEWSQFLGANPSSLKSRLDFGALVTWAW